MGDIRGQQLLQTLPLHLKCGLPVRRQQVHKAVEQRAWLLKRKLDEAEALWLKGGGMPQEKVSVNSKLSTCGASVRRCVSSLSNVAKVPVAAGKRNAGK